MMLTHSTAQGLVDGLSTVTLGAAVLANLDRPPTLLRSRLGFAFGGAFLLYLVRTSVNVLDMQSLSLLGPLIVCALPLAALLLAESVLRRHAPWSLKVLVSVGALAMAAILLVCRGNAPVTAWCLGVFIILSLTAVALLLFLRDRASLSVQENASIAALAGSGAILVLLSITDFLPGTPIGLSGIGAATVAFVLGANPTTAREAKHLLLSVLTIVLIGALSALIFAHPFGLDTCEEQIRLGTILFSLLLATYSILSSRQRFSSRANKDFARALGTADTTSLDNLLNGLADQPLIAGLRIAAGDMLADYDVTSLGAAMKDRAVWTRTILSDKTLQIPVRPRDELRDLMTRTDASHALVVSHSPLQIALLTLPDAGAADGTEINLALLHKLALASANHHDSR